MKKLILLLGVLCMLSCTRNVGLERTFQRAGENRVELEKVLRHYEEDERKRDAALFLLERMSDCYGYADPLIDSLQELRYLSSLPDREYWTDSVRKVWNHVSFYDSPKVYDAQVMTADYLINHIDHAFKVWDSRPWAQHYSFEEFCRYVLPYRLADEPLTAWRENYHLAFASRVDSIYEGSDIIRKIQAVQTIFQEDGSGWSELFSSLPHPSAAFLLEHPVGVCRELCGYVVFLLRSLGIPAVTDQYVASPQTSGAHWWNAVRDTTGHMVSFWLPESEVGRDKDDGRPKGKVFRLEYGGKVRDVTSEYFGSNEAAIKVLPDWKGKELDLCVFTCGRYVPVDKGEPKDRMALFIIWSRASAFFLCIGMRLANRCLRGIRSVLTVWEGQSVMFPILHLDIVRCSVASMPIIIILKNVVCVWLVIVWWAVLMRISALRFRCLLSPVP